MPEPPGVRPAPTILLAYTGSAATREVLRAAVQLGVALTARLDVLIITGLVDLSSETIAEVDQSRARQGRAARRLTNEVEAALADANLTAAIFLQRGRLRRALTRRSERQHFDVVVLPRPVGPLDVGFAATTRRLSARVGAVLIAGTARVGAPENRPRLGTGS